MRKQIYSSLLLLVVLASPGFSQEKPNPAPAPQTIVQPAPAPQASVPLQARTTIHATPTPAPKTPDRHPIDRGEARAIPTLIIHGF